MFVFVFHVEFMTYFAHLHVLCDMLWDCYQTHYTVTVQICLYMHTSITTNPTGKGSKNTKYAIYVY